MNFESRRMQVDRIAYESYASNSAAHRLCTKMCVSNVCKHCLTRPVGLYLPYWNSLC
jgi:hypothetical protein